MNASRWGCLCNSILTHRVAGSVGVISLALPVAVKASTFIRSFGCLFILFTTRATLLQAVRIWYFFVALGVPKTTCLRSSVKANATIDP